MANAFDEGNSTGRFQRELAKLDEAVHRGVVDQRDHSAMREYVAHRKGNAENIGTITTYLNRLRVSAERSEEPLVRFDSVEDIRAILTVHQNAGATAASTINNYLTALRQFFSWLEIVEEHGHTDYGFLTEMETPSSIEVIDQKSAFDPDTLLTEAEIDDLLSAADHPRERTLIAIFLGTGLSIGTVCQTTCGEFEFGLGRGDCVSLAKNITDIETPVRTWFERDHPEAPNPPYDAPLIPVKRGYEPGNWQQCSLSPSAGRDALRSVSKTAEMDPRRVRPRNLRRTGAIWLRARYGMSWEDIQSRGGWSQSSINDLRRVYDRIKEEDRFALSDREFSSSDEAGANGDIDSPGVCQYCGADILPDGRFCPQHHTHQSGGDGPRIGSFQKDSSGVGSATESAIHNGSGEQSPISDWDGNRGQTAVIRRQKERLELLDQINRLIRSVNQVLINAGNRHNILEGVGERLSASQLYQGAWTIEESLIGVAKPQHESHGESQNNDRPLVVEGHFEENHGAVEFINETSDFLAAVDSTIFDAIPETSGRWTTVPVIHGQTVYGTIILVSTRKNAFGDRELEVLDEIGQQVGHAVNAVEKELLLVSDTVTELRLAADDQDPLAVASRVADCDLIVEGIVPMGAKEVVVYSGVDGDIHEAVAALSGADGVTRLRPIDEVTVECGLGEGSLAVPLREVGAQLEHLGAKNGNCTVVARVSPDTNVRTIVNRVQQSVPSAELEAKCRREAGEPGPLEALASKELDDRLTDRQIETLEEAYGAGYFDWPRQSTAEEVAKQLGVTSPTVHNHLRKAESEVLGELLGK